MKLIPIAYILISLFSLSACSQNSPQDTDGDQKEKITQHIGCRYEGCEAVCESPFILSSLIPHWESISR